MYSPIFFNSRLMKQLFFYVLVFITSSAFAQKPEYLHFKPQHIQVTNSIFSNIEIIDTRFDTVYMGFVHKGALNRKAPIELAQSLKNEVLQFADTLIANASKESNTVLINIRNFFLSERTGGMSETGTFVFKAGCYLKNNDVYDLMFATDIIITLYSNWDVTKKLETTANEQLALLIKRAAIFNKDSATKTAYSFNDIEHIDTKEKESIPVYNVELPQKGLYASFEAFKNNGPTDTSFIEEFHKKSNVPVFYTVDADNKKGKAIATKNYYAICDGQQLYFATNYGVYPAIKKNYDFYFIGKGKETANASVVSTAYLTFGLLGGLVASIPANVTFEYKIDFTTGKFLPVKKIINNQKK